MGAYDVSWLCTADWRLHSVCVSQKTHWSDWSFYWLYSVVSFSCHVARHNRCVCPSFTCWFIMSAQVCIYQGQNICRFRYLMANICIIAVTVLRNFLFFMSGLFFSTFLLKCEYCSISSLSQINTQSKLSFLLFKYIKTRSCFLRQWLTHCRKLKINILEILLKNKKCNITSLRYTEKA